MSKPDDIPQVLRERLEYCPDTGEFRWRARPYDTFPDGRIAKNWNTRFAGKAAFAKPRSDGYREAHITVDGETFRVLGHVAAFAIVTGRMPAEAIDHKNREKGDNRFENLREATHAENTRNAVHPGKFMTGARPRNSRWEARISFNRKSFYLGIHDTEAQAHAAYCEKAAELHGEFAAIRKRGEA